MCQNMIITQFILCQDIILQGAECGPADVVDFLIDGHLAGGNGTQSVVIHKIRQSFPPPPPPTRTLLPNKSAGIGENNVNPVLWHFPIKVQIKLVWLSSMFIDLFISDKVDCVAKNFNSNGTNNNASSLSNIVYCIGSAANQKEFSPIFSLLTTVTLIVKPWHYSSFWARIKPSCSCFQMGTNPPSTSLYRIWNINDSPKRILNFVSCWRQLNRWPS